MPPSDALPDAFPNLSAKLSSYQALQQAKFSVLPGSLPCQALWPVDDPPAPTDPLCPCDHHLFLASRTPPPSPAKLSAQPSSAKLCQAPRPTKFLQGVGASLVGSPLNLYQASMLMILLPSVRDINVCAMSGQCLGHVWAMSGSCLGHVLVLSGTCLGHVWAMSEPCLGNV